MATSLHLSREVKVYVKFGDSIWEIPVLDGLSFSQGTNTAEVTLKEMADGSDVSRRGRLMFNDSLAPAEWSFSTYARPFKRSVDNIQHMAEEVLWAMMAGAETSEYATGTDKFSNVIDMDGSRALIDFNSSNQMVFPTATIYFKFAANDGAATGTDLWYEVQNATVNEVSADFDIDGITTLNWSGGGTKIVEPSSAPTVTPIEVTATELQSTSNFIRNRLSQITVQANAGATGTFPGAEADGSYSLVLTGGSITISNNIEYVTPSSLGIVNVPLGHTAGTRSVSGTFTCYLDHATGSSADLLEDLLGSATSIKNSFALTLSVGGSGSTPRVEFIMPTAHLEIPTHSIEEVISAEVNFHALPSDIAATDELTVKYVGA